jgi:hypothetical protein
VAELTRGVRRGVGWALGVGAVVVAGSAIQHGARETLKTAMKGIVRAREAGAEAAEQLQDLYAEAVSEHASERMSGGIIAEAMREHAAERAAGGRAA